MPSQALKQLEDRLADIDELLAVHRLGGGKGRGRRWYLVALNRSAVVLCCAHLEGFAGDLFREAFEFLVNQKPNAARVPSEVRLLALRPLAESVRDTSDPTRAERRLRKLVTAALSLGHPARQIKPGDIDYGIVLRQFSSPAPAAINKLFLHLGMRAVLGKISLRNRKPERVRRLINDLVERRNKIAHGTVGIRVGLGFVRGMRKFLPELGSALDERVRQHVERVVEQSPW